MTETRASLTQGQRTDTARRALIAATMEVLAGEGYRRTTFNRIQEVAGLSRALINYHFGTKLMLIESVIDEIRAEYLAVAQDRDEPGQNGYQRLRSQVTTYLERLGRDPRPAKVMLVLGTESIGEDPSIQAAVQEAYQRFREALRACIDRGIDDGSVRSDVDSAGYAALVEAIIRGVVLQYLVDPDEVDLKSVTAAALDCVGALATQRRDDEA